MSTILGLILAVIRAVALIAGYVILGLAMVAVVALLSPLLILVALDSMRRYG